jgi:hypothetical protein
VQILFNLKDLKLFFKFKVKSLKLKSKVKYTTCFGQYGHHQMLNVFVVIGETAALVVAVVVVVVYFPEMRTYVVVTVSSFFS